MLKWKTKKHMLYLAILLFLAASISKQPYVAAQESGVRRPIDMMVLIDNSCSMFPEDRRISGCETWGSDPKSLRLVGADLFFARLGFAEPNEDDYQMGVISIGKSPKMISSLQPLGHARDTLAKLIANPAPELATGIVPALELAYDELRTSPERRPTNLPAVVLITDGVPYPPEGQSDADLERLIKTNTDVPIFVMLLQDPDATTASSDAFDQYIDFWGQMQLRYSNVFAYRIKDSSEIEKTYNDILSQLQNSIPAPGIMLTPATPLSVYVSEFVQKIVITLVPEYGHTVGKITVQDPKGGIIADGEPGIVYFVGDDNPVQVISIAPPRLSADLKNDYWTIASDTPVMVYLVREGAYRINFVDPPVSLTDVANVYVATERQSPLHPFAVRFNLIDLKANPVLMGQPIQGKVIFPDGTQDDLRVPSGLLPTADGVYEFLFDAAAFYPDILDTPGRFILIFDAGSADDRAEERIPIANARLVVDVGRGPIIETIEPLPLVCYPDQPAEIGVTLADIETARPDTLMLRLFGPSSDMILDPIASNKYKGDAAALCEPLLRDLPCSTQQEVRFRLRLNAQLLGGETLLPLEREVLVQVRAAPCPPTVTPTPTPTPTPPPPPPGDQDRDGIIDDLDSCPDEPQMGVISWFDGCPPPLWLWIVLGIAGVGLLAFTWFYAWPWIRVHTFAPPPRCFVVVCGIKNFSSEPRDIYEIGMARRVSKVKIGGDAAKSHFHVPGLKPVEFEVEQQGGRIALTNLLSKQIKPIGDTGYSTITASSGATLRVGKDSSKIAKC